MLSAVRGGGTVDFGKLKSAEADEEIGEWEMGVYGGGYDSVLVCTEERRG